MKSLFEQFIGSILSEGSTFKAVRVGKGGSTDRVVVFGSKESMQAALSAGSHVAYNEKDHKHLSSEPADKPQASTATPKQKTDTTAKVRAPAKTNKQKKIEPINVPLATLSNSFGSNPSVPGLLKAILGVVTKKKGDKGAGTVASTAGEAAAVLGVERLMDMRKKNPKLSTDEFLKSADGELVTLMGQLQGVNKSVLTPAWAHAARNQTIAVFSTIEKDYGPMEQIGWDNADGRQSLGLPAKKPSNDRSDMYVKLADGRILGISLKKDGKIFLANDGLKRALDKVSKLATSVEAKNKLNAVAAKHKIDVAGGFDKLKIDVKKNSKLAAKELQKLTRKGIGDVDSSKYDVYFNGKRPDAKLNKKTIQLLSSGDVSGQTGVTGALFIKSMGSVSRNVSDFRGGLLDMRQADTKATKTLLALTEKDPEVRATMTRFLIDGLDLKQIVTKGQPFGENAGVDGFFVAYGEADVREDGARHPMIANRSVVLRALGLPDDISDEEFETKVNEAFIIDPGEVGATGFLRLRSVNDSPPPPYFYPTISELMVRSKGLGKSGSLLMEQGSGWTYTLLNGTANPAEWPAHQRVAHAQDTIEFLTRRLKSPDLTKQQRAALEKEIEAFRKIEQSK